MQAHATVIWTAIGAAIGISSSVISMRLFLLDYLLSLPEPVVLISLSGVILLSLIGFVVCSKLVNKLKKEGRNQE